MDYPAKIRAHLAAGRAIPEIADRLGISYQAVRYHVRKNGMPYTPDSGRASRKLLPGLAEMVASGMTSGEIARAHGVSAKNVWKWIRKLKIPYTPDQAGARNPSWNGGRRKIGPYVYVWCPEHPFATTFGCVLEHRLVMELKIGRYLLPEEVVHHIQGYKNNPENLHLFSSNAEHLAVTLKGKVPNWTPDGRRRILEAIRRPRGPHKEPNRDKSEKRASP